MFYIYGLIDPRNGELRYVGKTNNLSVRFKRHCYATSLGTHKSSWIKSLKRLNLEPQLLVLEEYSQESASLSAEQELIAYYRSIGRTPSAMLVSSAMIYFL